MITLDHYVSTIKSHLNSLSVEYKNLPSEIEDVHIFEVSTAFGGFNLFIDGACTSDKAKSTFSPYILVDDKKFFLPIVECLDHYADALENIGTLIVINLNCIERASYLIQNFSDMCARVCAKNGHVFDEGKNTIHRMDDSEHFIYYFDIGISNGITINRITFLVDISNCQLSLKYRINDLEFVSVPTFKSIKKTYQNLTYTFMRKHGQVYVPISVYNEIFSNPRKYGENILVFPLKKPRLITKS